MKDELAGKLMTAFFELSFKTYSSLINDGQENKGAKGTRKSLIQSKRKFQDCI